MSPTEPRLDQIQRWMQAVVMHPDGVQAGVESPAAQEQLEVTPDDLARVVARRGALTESAALAIYNRGYRARLLECFRQEYPALRYALGAELFDHFALDYLAAHPSQTHSLVFLSAQFPAHLAATRPDSDAEVGERESWPDFIVDLARLERSFNEVFHGPGSERQAVAGELPQPLPADWWTRRWEPAEGLRLHAFRYPVVEYFAACRRDAEPPLPAPTDSWVALYRREYRVRMQPLTQDAYEFLSALLSGHTPEQATAASARPHDTDRQQLRSWLHSWLQQKFFAAS